MRAELIYDTACPNVEAARAELLRAFVSTGIPPRWREWDTAASDTPQHARGYGSPTILVDGRDVSGAAPIQTGGNSCRVYAHGNKGSSGVPPLADIVRALRSPPDAAANARGSARWPLSGAMIPAVGFALLPKLTCPACWPAYAGLLSSLGVGFFDYTPYLLPLTIVFILIAIAGLAFRARSRRGYGPLILGAAGSAILLAGKFAYESDVAMYTGIAVLLAASIWNTWPKSPAGSSGRGGRGAQNTDTCCNHELNGGSHGRETTY